MLKINLFDLAMPTYPEVSLEVQKIILMDRVYSAVPGYEANYNIASDLSTFSYTHNTTYQ